MTTYEKPTEEGDRKFAVTKRLKCHVNDPKMTLGYSSWLELEPGSVLCSCDIFL
jgi:hypothetical protein